MRKISSPLIRARRIARRIEDIFDPLMDPVPHAWDIQCASDADNPGVALTVSGTAQGLLHGLVQIYVQIARTDPAIARQIVEGAYEAFDTWLDQETRRNAG